MKLGLKLTLILLPLVALPLLVVGSVSYFNLLDNAKARQFALLEASMEQVARQAENLIQNARANATLFADLQSVQNYLLIEDESIRYDLLYRPLMHELRSIQQTFPNYYELRIILPDGFEDLRSTEREIPNRTEDESQDPGFKSIQQSTSDILSQLAINPDNGEISCYIYKRIELIDKAVEGPGTTPSLRGYFSLTADIQPLLLTLQDHPLGKNGGLYLTDAEGQLLLIPPQLAWLATEQRRFTDHLTEPPQGKIHPLELSGERYYVAHHPIFPDLWIHALLPEEVLLLQSQAISKIVAQVTIVALFISLSLLFATVRVQVLHPIQKLTNALLRTGKGEELVQVSLGRKDEFGQLENEFNQMSLALKESNDQVRNMAYCDNLTQLPNRFMFNRNLKRTIEISRKENKQFALLYMDLIKFKQINDTLGHLLGDKMLIKLAERLAENLRGGDIASRAVNGSSDEGNLSRLGGDEFCVLLPDIKLSINAAKAAERLIELIEQPVDLGGQEHVVSVSIGIAIYPDDGKTSVELIKNADLAMYEAKKLGKGAYEFFSQKLSQQVFERTRLEQRLLLATDKKAFELHYQPILAETSLELSSLEALIRWTDEELGPVPPDCFIELAEDMGLIHEIGKWVITEVCQQLKNWEKQGLEQVTVAINISGRQFEKGYFAEQVVQILESTGTAPANILLELTESALIQKDSDILANLDKLRRHGIKIALDDFGTGYSSLSYLRNLPIDILKIDRSFIQALGDKNNSIILSAIITMAHALGLKVVAEGIEEQGQFAFLKKEKCDFLQGYLFSRPQPAAKITEKLLERSKQTSASSNLSDFTF